jgi:hypothetical protein
MTKNQLQKIVRKHILASLDNYKLKNEYLVKMPIDDIVVGFCFERAYAENFGYVWWFSLPTFLPNNSLHLTFGDRIKLDSGNELWDFGPKEIGASTSKLIFFLRDFQQKLFELQNPVNFYNYFVSSKEKNIRIYEAIAYAACWNGHENMLEEVNGCLNFISENLDTSIPWIKQVYDDLIRINKLKSREKILELLNQWKVNSLAEINS